MLELQVYQLSVGQAFDGLNNKDKRYAHYMAKAAWSGTRIILRQVSPEANDIFDLIMALYHSCDGRWEELAMERQVNPSEVQKFIDYAAMFQIISGPEIHTGDIEREPNEACFLIGSCESLLEGIRDSMYAENPNSLGLPGPFTQTAYYLGDGCLASQEDTSAISSLMEDDGIPPKNTRLKRIDGKHYYDILQASVQENKYVFKDEIGSSTINQVRLVAGNHREELRRVCHYLEQAIQYASDFCRQEYLKGIHESFLTGDLKAYKDAQRIWVNDKAPAVETVMGFVEPYRDPLGVRAEFEGIVGIADTAETKRLQGLADIADQLVGRLPWVEENSTSKGAFEKEMFEPPGFSSVKSLAYFSSIVFPGINLPNYNDIRQETGYKNIIFSNWMVAESKRARGLHMVDPNTGARQWQAPERDFNFDPQSPPLNPLTEKPVDSWYGLGQTSTSIFEDLATTVDEYRAKLVGAYSIDESEILELFGYDGQSEVASDDVTYNMYLQLGVDRLRGLENYDPISKKWGQAHCRAHYAILRHLLRDSDGLYTIHLDFNSDRLTVKVNRSQILQKGKPSLGRMLLHLHIYRCTADKYNCRKLYEDLSHVDEEALRWRDVVVSRKDPPLVFCHANTFLEGDEVMLKEYEPTSCGVIQSWAERQADVV